MPKHIVNTLHTSIQGLANTLSSYDLHKGLVKSNSHMDYLPFLHSRFFLAFVIHLKKNLVDSNVNHILKNIWCIAVKLRKQNIHTYLKYTCKN